MPNCGFDTRKEHNERRVVFCRSTYLRFTLHWPSRLIPLPETLPYKGVNFSWSPPPFRVSLLWKWNQWEGNSGNLGERERGCCRDRQSALLSIWSSISLDLWKCCNCWESISIICYWLFFIIFYIITERCKFSIVVVARCLKKIASRKSTK